MGTLVSESGGFRAKNAKCERKEGLARYCYSF